MSWLTMLGTSRASCDGITRRETLAAGALTFLGGMFNTRSLLAVERSAEAVYRPARAKSVVLLYLQGGPPTQDMFDLKPTAPSDVAGEFKPIASSAPGVEVGELLPLTARWMHKAAVVRSVYHQAACHLNVPMYTGYDINLPDEEFRDSDPPSMGSVCAYLERDQQKELPTYAYLPCPLGWGELRKKAGPYGGFLGRRYDPFCTECTAYVDSPPEQQFHAQPLRGEPKLTDMDLLDGVTLDRLDGRRRLVEQFDDRFRELDRRGDLGNFPTQQRLAFNMLASAKVREAFDLSLEDDATRERYGRTLFGSSTLMARRLVERGVRFVQLYSGGAHNDDNWDAHTDIIKNHSFHAGNTDLPIAGLLRDLKQRGLLDETLVIWGGEFGRLPIAQTGKKPGRDHNPHGFTLWMAGGGVKGGVSHGESDDVGYMAAVDKVHINDLHATILHLLGLDHQRLTYNYNGRRFRLTDVAGNVIRPILA
jgi:hypothetical protein